MDAVILGAGIAGAAAAWHLTRAGARVVVVEREPSAGLHATGRSAAVLSETSGHRTVCALARASRPFLEAPPDGFGEATITGPRGLLWVGRAGDEPALDALAAVAASGVAPTARRVDAAAALELHPSLRPEAVAAGGCWEPDARSVDVDALLQGYLSGVRRGGGTILTGLDPTVERTGDGWRVTGGAAGAGWSTPVVVNAAGAWADAVATAAGVEPLGLTPLRRTACLVPAPDELRGRPLVMDVAGRYYFEPEAGGLLLSPADEAPSDPCDARAEELDVALALDRLREATTLDVRSVRRAWAGLRTFAPDRIPVLGMDPDAPGFLWLAGQGGAGIKTAPAMADAATALITGTAWPTPLTDLGVNPEDLSPARFRRGR